MGMFDNIIFEDSFSTSKDLPDEMLTNDWGQTKQLFCVLDFYSFRKQDNGNYQLCRMFPPMSRTDMEAGNKGRVSEFVESIEPYNNSIDDYAHWWTPINNAEGYLRIGQRHNGFDYEYIVTVNNGVLEHIIPYSKTKLNKYDEEPESYGGYMKNVDKVNNILENRNPIV